MNPEGRTWYLISRLSKLARRTRRPAQTRVLRLSIAARDHGTLSTFRIHSEILFAPHCRAWTLDVLNSFPLTTLSISGRGVPTDVLDTLLSQTEIPTLSDLSLVKCEITRSGLHRFLARHPSITSLHFDDLPESVFVPDVSVLLWGPLPDFLPRLATLSAAAPKVACILHAMPHTAALRTVRVHSAMDKFDILIADISLIGFAPRLAPPIALSLVLPVPDVLRSIPDLDRAFSTNSTLQTTVSTLEFVFGDSAARALATYVALARLAAFPMLRTIELVGGDGADTARILAAFQARAPGVERVVWRTT
ncbi:hypothetical protein B0H17DRAFT_1200902 [Mycena rosella]|uniref:F-box domain-containing protein n=1 Tax=Mycena rosella TaxID=1033263 RepID=A0AAD7GHZ8_MYCRO|nr:hypothetical protein B0H17DRAFT_1200902 [Mycena rosella]